jgi:hypothetical protein
MLHLPSRYYKCLAAIETRFPISSEKGNVRINFPWTDAFRSSKKTSQANIHFEKAAVLFNVAAILSQQALQVMSAGFATVVPSVLPAAAIAIMLQQAALSFWVAPGAKFTLPWTFADRNWLIPCLIPCLQVERASSEGITQAGKVFQVSVVSMLAMLLPIAAFDTQHLDLASCGILSV